MELRTEVVQWIKQQLSDPSLVQEVVDFIAEYKGTTLSDDLRAWPLSEEARDLLADHYRMTQEVRTLVEKYPRVENKEDPWDSADEIVPLPGLFVGSMTASRNKKWLNENKITHILTVASSLDPAYPDEFTYKVLAIMDVPSENLGSKLGELVEWIDQARNGGGRVLVHWYVNDAQRENRNLSNDHLPILV